MELYRLHREPWRLVGFSGRYETIPTYVWERVMFSDEAKEYEDLWLEDAGIAVLYAQDHIGGRWPEAEPIILENPEEALRYARFVLKRAWPEAEPLLAENDWSAYYYAEFLKRRFPLGEPAIATDAYYSLKYALEVIEAPFPAGEPAIVEETEDNLPDTFLAAYLRAFPYRLDDIQKLQKRTR